MAKRQIKPVEIEETQIISETINPVALELPDAEFPLPDVEFPISPENLLEEIEKEKLVLMENPPQPTEKVIETNRFIESEILYETNNPDRSAWDLTDALIDLESIYSVERILDKDRFSDFGCIDPVKHELHPEDCCVIFSTAYPLGVILVEMTYEDITKILIAYKG